MKGPTSIALAALAALALASLAGGAGNAASACQTYEADNFDLSNAGTHEPELGALAFATLVGTTDVRFEACGWPRADWEPLRTQILELAPKVFAKAGVPQGQIESQIELGRKQTRGWTSKLPRSAQCVAPAGTLPIEQRLLRSERHVLEWGQTYLRC